jgi:hypothetical protein
VTSCSRNSEPSHTQNKYPNSVGIVIVPSDPDHSQPLALPAG